MNDTPVRSRQEEERMPRISMTRSQKWQHRHRRGQAELELESVQNLVRASAGESFSAQLKNSSPDGLLWPCPLIAAARVVSMAGVSRRENPGGERHQCKGCPGRISSFGAAPNAGSIYFVMCAGCRGGDTKPARIHTFFFNFQSPRTKPSRPTFYSSSTVISS